MDPGASDAAETLYPCSLFSRDCEVHMFPVRSMGCCISLHVKCVYVCMNVEISYEFPKEI